MTVLEKELATTTVESRREALEMLRVPVACGACGGSRLNKRANSVYFEGKNIGQLTALSIGAAEKFFDRDLGNGVLEDDRAAIAEPLIEAIRQRLNFLNQVGVGYLALDRAANTLSGGEYQRVRLATSIGTGLTNVCYVLDEPSIGLHPRDNQKLIESIQSLKHSGNTVVVVEHDEAMIRAADHIIDIGPEAGTRGGRIVAIGTAAEVAANSHSLTGNYLAGRSRIEVPRRRQWNDSLRINAAAGNNLKHIDVEIPLGCFVCVTGVSGSGKSTLINNTLAPALARSIGLIATRPAPVGSITGAEKIDKLVLIHQRPPGRTSRGCAATYSGVFTEIRKLFAATKLARERGFTHSRFSFNSKSGRCPDCFGQGTKRVKMHFLNDLFVQCDSCGGRRYNKQTLQVRFRDLNIADVLQLSVSQALQEYLNFSKVRTILQSLVDVGLGYLQLGQSASTLSGGEAQRIKLATELATENTGNTLYVLDEPTTGLHFEDTRQLLLVLQKLVDLGNTVVVIEHNLDMIKSADWIIDLGPEGGEAGGYLVAVGTPEEVASNASSITGLFLQELV
jgi:excinuclease ABC subunit A